MARKLFSDAGTWFLAINGLLLAAFMLWLPLRGENPARTTLVADLAFLSFMWFLVVMTWRAAGAPGLNPRSRFGWRLIALGGAIYLFGNLVWSYYEVVRGIHAPFPSWADLGFVGFYPPILAGIGCLVRPLQSRAEATLFWLDLSVVAIGAGTLVWYFLLWPIAQGDHESALALVLAESYPLSATVLLVGAVALVLRPWDDRPVAPIAWLVAGLVTYFVADIRYAHETMTETYASGGLTDVFYHLSAWLMMVGAWLEYRGDRRRDPARHRFGGLERVLSVLPYLSVAALYGLLLQVAFSQAWDPLHGAGREALSGLVVAAVIIAVVVMIRQSVAAGEIARLRADRAMRESEVRFTSLARHSSDLIALVGPDLHLQFTSPAVVRVLGLASDDLAGRPLNDLIHPDDRPAALAFLHAVLADRGAVAARTEWRMQRADGTWRDIEALATNLVDDPAVAGVVLNGRDITERKRFERDLEEARRAAEAASLAKSEFLALMSHEIRTPLNAVLGLAQVLERGTLAPDQRKMVERIQTAGHSLLAIINDILDMSKIEAGQLRIESAVFELEPLLAHLDSLLGQAAREKGLQLHIGAPDRPLGALLGDRQRLEQVLLNLLGNAIKFTERGQVDLRVAVHEGAGTVPRLRFTVQDTGIGIAPEILGRLFTPFTQADAGITRRFGGTGLGLSLCKRLVERMGGEIGVTSEPGAGSTFWFELSLPRADAAALGVAAPPPRPGPRLTGLHVLVVDDSAMNRDLVEQALGLEGATATLAGDGQQALDTLRARPGAFAAVLMDVRMPVLDGLAATRRIRAELGLTELPIIALTAGVFPEQTAAAREAGVNDVLAKPVDLDRMTECLLQWVGPRPEAAPAAVPGAHATDQFPAIAGIDRDRAADNLGGNRRLYLRLLQGLDAESAETLPATRRALAAGDRDTAARLLHTLKGSAGHIGALDLMAAADRLEAAIAQGETALESRLAALAAQLTALLAACRPWWDTAPAAVPVPAADAPPDAEGLANRLADLREALQGNSLAALSLCDELAPTLQARLGPTRAAAFRQDVLGLRFADALTILDQAATDT